MEGSPLGSQNQKRQVANELTTCRGVIIETKLT